MIDDFQIVVSSLSFFIFQKIVSRWNSVDFNYNLVFIEEKERLKDSKIGIEHLEDIYSIKIINQFEFYEIKLRLY